MKTALIICFIVATVGATRFNYKSLSNSVERTSGLCYTANSIICSQDCKKMFLCVRDEGVWSQILIESCAGNTYCNGNENRCTSQLSTCSPVDTPAFKLNCKATGHFPDPYDCTVYHNCATIGAESAVAACPSGWSYNAVTTECDHSVADGLCFPAGRIPDCTTPGQSGPVPENTNIYYVCLHSDTGLVPELFKCAHGGHYSNGQCNH